MWGRLFGATVAILVAEAAVMWLLAFLEVVSVPYLTAFDAALLSLLVFPLLYSIFFRPLMRELSERTRAEDAVRRSVEAQTALYRVTSAAVHSLDPVALLDRVIAEVLPAVKADAAWVTVPNPDPARPPRVAASRGVPEEFLAAEVASPLSQCPACQPLLDGKISGLDLRSLDACPRLPKGILARAGLETHVDVPLRASGGGLAILSIAWREAATLSEADRALLASIGNQVGIALENAHLYQAEQQARSTAETLRHASFALGRSLELETVLATLLEHLAQLVPYDSARVILVENGPHLRVRAMASRSGSVSTPGNKELWIDTETNPLIRDLLESRKSIVVAEARRPGGTDGHAPDDSERSWLGVPLIAGNKVHGLFSLSKAEPYSFIEEHVQLGEALAAAAAVAIENAALFDQVRSGRERLRSLSRQLVELQETERRTIARELHDEAGQALSSLLVGLRLLERDAARPELVASRTADLRRIANGVQENLHRLAADLRPASLDHLGLVAALRSYLEEIDRHHSPRVQFETVGIGNGRLPAAVETALYRIAQEAVLNALRHSGAQRLSVLLERRNQSIILIIEDDGSGFNAQLAARGKRLGLVGMRERAEMLGGSLTLETARGAGTTIAVEIPHAD